MKHLNKTPLRKLIRHDQTFLWKRSHVHLKEYIHSECTEQVVIFLEGFKNSSLRIHFREEDNLSIQHDITKRKWCVGYPDSGVIWLSTTPQKENTPVINLNRSAVIRQLIDFFYGMEWRPETTNKTFEIQHGLELLEHIEFTTGY